MYWPYGNRWLKNPNMLHLHMLIRQFLCSKILILGQNPNFWQHCSTTISGSGKLLAITVCVCFHEYNIIWDNNIVINKDGATLSTTDSRLLIISCNIIVMIITPGHKVKAKHEAIEGIPMN